MLHVGRHDVAERLERREVFVVIVEPVADVEHRAREQLAQGAAPQPFADARGEEAAVVAVLVEALDRRHILVGEYPLLSDSRLRRIVVRFANVRYLIGYVLPASLGRHLLLASDFASASGPAPQWPLGVEGRPGLSGDAAILCVHAQFSPIPSPNPDACASS